jgi:hypothetical protein
VSNGRFTFKAVAQGMIAFYGTYTVNEGDKTVTTRIEGSSYPNLIGAEQKRVITSLTADELRYTNPATSTGTKAEAVWRRQVKSRIKRESGPALAIRGGTFAGQRVPIIANIGRPCTERAHPCSQSLSRRVNVGLWRHQ